MRNSAWLIDRKYIFYDIKLEELPSGNPRAEILHVFDGELVKDRTEDTLKFLIFDALVVDGINVMLYSFENRLRTVFTKIIKKLRVKEYLELHRDPIDKIDDENDLANDSFDVLDDYPSSNNAIKVYLKDFFLDINTEFLYTNIKNNLDHDNDGIIYTMNDCPYYPGTCQEIIKWKPQDMNSVDFWLKKITSYSEKDYVWGLYARTHDTPEFLYDCMFFEDEKENAKWDEETQKWAKSGKSLILECTYSTTIVIDILIRFNYYKRMVQTTDYPKEEAIIQKFDSKMEISDSLRSQLKGGWIIERQRTDKNYPNALAVAENIKHTIVNPLTFEDLCQYCEGFKSKYGGNNRKRLSTTTQNGNHKRQKTSE